MADKDKDNKAAIDIDSIPWDERAKLIEKGEPTGCPLLDSFLKEPLPAMCQEVMDIRDNQVRRMYVEAALLTESPSGIIGDVLDIPGEIVEYYSKVFFDVLSMDRLNKVELVHKCEDDSERQLKLWALTQGLDFIAWRLGKTIKVSPIEGLNSLMSDSYFKAKESFFNVSTSESSKEAYKWTKQTMELAKLLKSWVSDADEAVRDIEFALQEYIDGELQFDLLSDLNLNEEPYVEEEDEGKQEGTDE